MSRSRAKGTAWESETVRYLQTAFPTVRRTGSADFGGGDIAGIPNTVIECKSVAKIELAAILDQTEAAGQRNGADIRAAWIKRRGKTSAADGYVVMSGAQFLWILNALIEVDQDGRP